MTVHVSQKKKDVVKEFTQLIESYPVIAAIDLENLPSKQLNDMRAQLQGTALIVMTKRRLLKIAIDNSKKEDIKKLKEHLKGMPALLFTKENPFKLYSTLKKNKSAAPIKAGQKAPNNIIVKAGATNFAPGPIIGELGSFGIKAGIESGKVAIKEDKIVLKEGEEATQKLAGLLQRLGIKPMEIGLNLTAAYENGEILLKGVLDIDEEAFKNRITTAASEAFNLAIEAGYTTKDTINLLLSKAHSQALALAESQDIMTSETVKSTLAKAEAQASALKQKL